MIRVYLPHLSGCHLGKTLLRRHLCEFGSFFFNIIQDFCFLWQLNGFSYFVKQRTRQNIWAVSYDLIKQNANTFTMLIMFNS